MFIDITDTSSSKVEGFKYTNENGSEEFVEITGSNTVSIQTNGPCAACSLVYMTDVPKLIKALQMAYSHSKFLKESAFGEC